jgi:hypothetical protein
LIASSSETGLSTGRPLPLTVLCLLGWLAIALAVVRIIARWDAFSTLPSTHLASALLALAIAALALLGYWYLRRWGLWLALLAGIARAAAGLAGVLALRPADLFWPGVIVLFGLVYYRRLR